VLIAIIDYGSGNIHSVQKALEYVAPNAKVVHTDDKTTLLNADKIIFPGQGAMGSCMQKISNHHLENTIKIVAREKPFLGICLGIQLLFSHSEEQNSDGLDIFKGNVKHLQTSLKVPHMGWNNVKQTRDHPLWHNIPDESYFYSVHSYIIHPENKNIIIGTTKYENEFACAVAKDNIYAVQFHPEKSGDNGLQLLRNFVSFT
jgi:glutamine amidotransferase